MKYHVKNKEAFNVIGLELKTTYKRAQVEIGQLWNKFIAENIADKIPNITHIEPVALYYEYGGQGMCCPMGPDSYAMLLGCKVANLDTIPVGMTGKAVPKQKYAVFNITNQLPESLAQAWEAINALGLNRSLQYDFEDYKYIQEPMPVHDVRLGMNYTKTFDTAITEVDIYVGIKD